MYMYKHRPLLLIVVNQAGQAGSGACCASQHSSEETLQTAPPPPAGHMPGASKPSASQRCANCIWVHSPAIVLLSLG